ncbi:hypothetical protein LR48_Vigan09g164000 [Vigna angularis]|uniref:Uncharacterized protein n=1 Tax=Phaseolus angularis TaxID=3914 RepID=A0A0L9VD55_PHAAN|nr:hypothetical protein LR48_Vigan09g164000 [Vigna angularis]
MSLSNTVRSVYCSNTRQPGQTRLNDVGSQRSPTRLNDVGPQRSSTRSNQVVVVIGAVGGASSQVRDVNPSTDVMIRRRISTSVEGVTNVKRMCDIRSGAPVILSTETEQQNTRIRKLTSSGFLHPRTHRPRTTAYHHLHTTTTGTPTPPHHQRLSDGTKRISREKDVGREGDRCEKRVRDGCGGESETEWGVRLI